MVDGSRRERKSVNKNKRCVTIFVWFEKGLWMIHYNETELLSYVTIADGFDYCTILEREWLRLMSSEDPVSFACEKSNGRIDGGVDHYLDTRRDS